MYLYLILPVALPYVPAIEPIAPKMVAVVMKDGRQVGINLEKFANTKPQKGISLFINKFNQQ